LGRQKNILFRKSADKAIATKYKISLETLDRKIKESSTKLLSVLNAVKNKGWTIRF
jgi:hypothetical protein